MKKIKYRPVTPCWYCQSTHVSPITYSEKDSFGDVRDTGWYICAKCGATAQEKPVKLGPGPKVMPWGAYTRVVRKTFGR